MKTTSLFIVPIALTFLIPFFASAATYDLLAPIGGMSTGLNLSMYLQGIFEFMVGMAGILAVVMMVWCGVKLMGSPSVATKSEAKQCITNAILGVLLAAGSWIILNTINSQLMLSDLTLGNTATLPVLGTAGPITEPLPRTPGWYFKYEDSNLNVRYRGPFAQAMCEEVRGKASGDTTVQVKSLCFEVTATAVPVVPGATPAPATTGDRCTMTGVNLCEPRMWRSGGNCTNQKCAPFAAHAASQAVGVASKELIKAVIWQESSCNTTAVGPSTKYGQACGPMQMLPSTANTVRTLCGVTVNVDCSWLTNPANTEKAICMGAQYLNKLTLQCGTSVRNIAAGYNAGPGNCTTSADCGGDTSCQAPDPVRKWECLYNNAGHTICNTGFEETRRYATQVLYCNNKPGF